MTPILSATVNGAAVAVQITVKLKAIYIFNPAAGNTVTFREASSTGTIKLTLATPAASQQPTLYLLLPGEGIRFEGGLYVDPGSAPSVTVFYG